ncbi:hypothetical protein DFH07DRAFT_903245 [Mycena maculata]|uniref:DUF4419 domain-containing protein n=1 Tax=Mycena maculata TaxID=230809 RepID=A0AAD7JF39_9AGAR|nr:hypothetical protein DFH07DRAFT_903245 [Mycena maculata]
MPVSFPVATHPAKPFTGRKGHTAKETLALACPDQDTKAGEIFQFSFPLESHGKSKDGLGSEHDFYTKTLDLIPNQNGFVATLLDAYTKDRALVVRPDDVWLAILNHFVAHKGKRELVIDARPQTRYTINFGDVARQMADLIEKNVVDPALRAWAMPAFTTTTANDTAVSAVLLMATLKHYFEYKILAGGCGIPRVTLEGERSDWVNILGRLEKLKEYGIETTAWYHLLRPVITRFVAAFDAPTSPANVDFWQCVAHYEPGGSGRGDYYTGWLTAFTVFNKEGQWLGHRLDTTAAPGTDPETLTAAQFWATYSTPDQRRGLVYDDEPHHLVFDDTPYHRLGGGKVPPGYGEVDVKLVDFDDGKTFDCVMVAGTVGTRVSSSGDRALSASGADDTVQPVAGWWLFVKEEHMQEESARSAFEARRRRW